MRTVDALMVPRGFVLVLSDNLLCGSLETEETQESHFLSTFVLKILSIFLYAAPSFLSLHLCSCVFFLYAPAKSTLVLQLSHYIPVNTVPWYHLLAAPM